MAPAACICDPGSELTAAVDKLAAHTTWFEGARSARAAPWEARTLERHVHHGPRCSTLGTAVAR